MSVVRPEQVEAFARDGFVAIEGALDADEISRYGRAVDAAVAGRSSGDDRAVKEKTLYEQSFIQCMNLWEDHPEVRALTFHPRLAEMAATLLGVAAVRVWHDQALYKEPGGRDYRRPPGSSLLAHQRPATRSRSGFPSTGRPARAAAWPTCPGSHRVGLKKFVDITRTRCTPSPTTSSNDPKIRDIEPVWVEVPPGTAVFHHSLCAHLAAPNETARMRRVFTVIYFADGCVRRAPWPHVSVDRQGIAVGEPIRGEVTPMAWPRAEGDLPPTPADFRPGPKTGYR